MKLDPDFIDLMNSLLEENPKKRLSISEIRKHPYMLGKTFSKEEAMK